MEIVVLKYDSKIENKGKQFLLKITNLCKDDDVLNIIQLLLFFKILLSTTSNKLYLQVGILES